MLLVHFSFPWEKTVGLHASSACVFLSCMRYFSFSYYLSQVFFVCFSSPEP